MTEKPSVLIESPAESAAGQLSSSSHLISELLTSMKLRGVQYRRVHAGPRFGISFAAKPGRAYFHFLAVGHAFLHTENGTVHELSTGNAVFMPHGRPHQLRSGPGVLLRDIDSHDCAPIGDAVGEVNVCLPDDPDPSPSTVLFTGYMEFDLGGMQGLNQIMPEIMIADAHGERYPGLLPILAAMRRETCSARVGFAGVSARLAEVVAAMIVRGWIECGCDNAPGLVAALGDPRLAGAILAMHRHPGYHWTVAELASRCHVSRSVFAERFHATIGVPPLRYATELRMLLASQWLAQDTMSVDAVARNLGYTSQAAFSRAFKRITGHPPGARRAASRTELAASRSA
ncbi:AraC family transcriptional regulator [Rhodococcus sovatensis]|uniref:AraC family transcriptional regulator n=1 Tax=Rhodococcus sovatensis TaxID=1805840 RepID=A0ABZ2PLS4_9NOCA